MIVSINSKNQAKYLELFEKSYSLLEKYGVDIKQEHQNADKRFQSLEQYYAYLADLVNIDQSYAMLPLDEEPFEIDANTRTIKVPSNFSKCASVQSDFMAEMAVFSIDRYFDYTDLNEKTEIWVQWTTQDANKNPIERASVCIKDEKNATDKLRFAWLLGPEITANPGVVKFAVRIFRRSEDGNEIVYSFNTLPAEITIKPALQPKMNSDLFVDDPLEDNTFKKAIINTSITTAGTIPMVPSFGAPGLNFKENEIKRLADSPLTLQAVTPDTGNITYVWQFSKDSDNWNNLVGGVEEAYIAIPSERPEGQEIHYSKRVLQEVYYQADGEDYKVYGGDFPVTGIQLYEKVTTYTIPKEGDVVGYYRAMAKNSIGDNTTRYVPSNVCQIPGPTPVEFTKNLPDNYTLKADKENILGVAVPADKNGALVTMTWMTSAESAEAGFVPVADATAANLAVTEPGWYRVDVKSNLNRAEETNSSAVCRVTNPVQPLVLSRVWSSDTEDLVVNPEVTECTLGVSHKVVTGLESDRITYSWFLGAEDLEPTPLTAEDVVDGEINGAMITAKLDRIPSARILTYICKVNNYLIGSDNKEASAESKMVFTIIRAAQN